METGLKTPSPQDFKAFFDRLPPWVVPLILILLFGRLVLWLLFHLVA
jgi:hypothetical protein